MYFFLFAYFLIFFVMISMILLHFFFLDLPNIQSIYRHITHVRISRFFFLKIIEWICSCVILLAFLKLPLSFKIIYLNILSITEMTFNVFKFAPVWVTFLRIILSNEIEKFPGDFKGFFEKISFFVY